MNLTEEQIERYSRHIILQGVGGEGQEKILNSKVLNYRTLNQLDTLCNTRPQYL